MENGKELTSRKHIILEAVMKCRQIMNFFADIVQQKSLRKVSKNYN